MKELIEIQKKLKVAKDQDGYQNRYKYRTCEGIYEAVKLLLGECNLTLSDEMIVLGDRFYIKATASFMTSTGRECTAHGWARECKAKTGLDEAQITGAASSYARKYALCGLFLIDGGEDPDKGDNSKEAKKRKKKEPLGIEQELRGLVDKFFEELPNAEDDRIAVAEKYESISNYKHYSTPEIKTNIINYFNEETDKYINKQEGE